MGAKVKRSFRSTCHDDNSTSTLNQHSKAYPKEPSFAPSQVPSSSSYMGSEFTNNNTNTGSNVPPRRSVTLEEMILQLEVEEEKARREKAANYRHKDEERDEAGLNFPRRMSCVNNSDILRSARNALNQYPRFSLDGRDAMYRSSFHNNNVGRAIDGLKLGRILHMPQNVGGESVIWCKPGVVPKLMGLEAMPLPISRLYNNNHSKNKHTKEKLCNAIRTQNLRRRIERNEMEKKQRRHHVMDSTSSNCRNIKRPDRGGCGGGRGRGRDGGCSSHSCSSTGHCGMTPIAMEPVYGLGGPVTWPTPYNHT